MTEINKLTVEQYMSVIEHDDSLGMTADKCEEVRKKFRRCIQSYFKYIDTSDIWEKKTVWNAFVAIFQLFRYLTSGDYADATNKGKVKALLNKDHEGDEIAATLMDASFLFSHKPVFAEIDKPVNENKSVNEKKNCDLLLDGLSKGMLNTCPDFVVYQNRNGRDKKELFWMPSLSLRGRILGRKRNTRLKIALAQISASA